ncbi:MAG: hypothetical protein L6277_15885 [Desulfobacterales bacterium]|nr:hypothetical protein [Desulfobacterales bacterium]
MSKRDEYLAEFNQITAQNDGFLRAEDVVAYARDPETALHKCFEWDDGIAADGFRRAQARALIRVVVSVTPASGEKYRAFVSMKDDRYNGAGYRATAAVMGEQVLREAYLSEVEQDMRTFMNKWEHLKELSKVFAEMEAVMQPRASQAKGKRKFKRPPLGASQGVAAGM